MIFKCNFHLLRRLCVLGGLGRKWDVRRGYCGCAAVVHFCVLPVTVFASASVCDPCLAPHPPPAATPLAFMCVSVRQRQKRGGAGGSTGLACGKIRVRRVLLSAEKAMAEANANAKAKAKAIAAADSTMRTQTQRLGLTGINVMRPILSFCRCTLCGCCMPAPNTPL